MANVHDPEADLLRADLEHAGIRRAALHGLDWASWLSLAPGPVPDQAVCGASRRK
jgi:hypothetical protein